MLLLLLPLLAVCSALSPLPKPGPFKYGPPAPRPCSFKYGQWGPCTATCGAATQTRHNVIFSTNPNREGCPAASDTRPCIGLPSCNVPVPRRPTLVPRAPPVHRYAPKPVIHRAPVRPVLPPVAPLPVLRTPYGYGRTPKAQAPPAPINNNKYPVDCERLDNGLVPDPTNKCSHKFYSCANGITFERECYGKLYYDIDTQACDQYQYVPACSGNKRPPSTPAPYPTVTPTPELDCTKLEDGLHIDPVKECSQRYFMCAHGDTSEMECAAGLYFDVQSGQCDRYIKVFACSGKQYVEPPHIIKNDHGIPVPVDFDCSTVEDGHYADQYEKCSQRFFHCANKIGYEKYCAGNTFFDEEFGVCDGYMNIPACSGNPRPPKVIEPPVVLAPKPDYPYNCDEKYDGNYEAGTCEVYYWVCIGGTTDKQECPANTKYDPILDQCENDEFVPGCGGLPRTTPGPQLAPPATIPPAFDCEQQIDGNYVPSPCSNTYYTCSNGETYEGHCPGATKFDLANDRCDVPKEIPECGHTGYGKPKPVHTFKPKPVHIYKPVPKVFKPVYKPAHIQPKPVFKPKVFAPKVVVPRFPTRRVHQPVGYGRQRHYGQGRHF